MIRYKEAPELTRATLTPEQQLRILHEETAPSLANRGRWHAALWLIPTATFLAALGLVSWGILAAGMALVGLIATRQERQAWSKTHRQVAALARSVRGIDAVAPLLDFARWQGRDATACYEALERLLPRLDTARARELTLTQRAFLRHCAWNQEPSVDLAVAGLLVLASAGDRETVPIARQLAVGSSSQRIREAALLCLEELGGAES